MPKRACLALIAFLLLAGIASAQVKLPESLKAKAGRVLVIEAEAKAAKIVWWCLEARKGELDLLPLDGGKAVFVAPQPGKYLVLAFCADCTAPCECWITVEGAPPPPPQPSEFERQLKAAWDAEPQKDPYRLSLLIELYKQAADKDSQDPSIKTISQLYSTLSAAGERLFKGGLILKTRMAIAEELKRTLPPYDAPTVMDDQLRQLCRVTFLRIAAALEKLR